LIADWRVFVNLGTANQKSEIKNLKSKIFIARSRQSIAYQRESRHVDAPSAS